MDLLENSHWRPGILNWLHTVRLLDPGYKIEHDTRGRRARNLLSKNWIQFKPSITNLSRGILHGYESGWTFFRRAILQFWYGQVPSELIPLL